MYLKSAARDEARSDGETAFLRGRGDRRKVFRPMLAVRIHADENVAFRMFKSVHHARGKSARAFMRQRDRERIGGTHGIDCVIGRMVVADDDLQVRQI